MLLLLLKCASLWFFNLCLSLFSFPNSVLVRDVEEHTTESFSLASLRNFNGRIAFVQPNTCPTYTYTVLFLDRSTDLTFNAYKFTPQPCYRSALILIRHLDLSTCQGGCGPQKWFLEEWGVVPKDTAAAQNPNCLLGNVLACCLTIVLCTHKVLYKQE